jgi:hypothetical protein
VPAATGNVGLVCIVALAVTFASGGLRWDLGSRRPASMSNLKQMGLVFLMSAKEHGEYPPLTRYGGYWMVDLETIYPHYISDLSIFVNPRSDYGDELHKEMRRLSEQKPVDWDAITRLASWSYVYLPWEVRSEEEFALVAQHVSALPRDGLPVGGPLLIGDRTFMPHTRAADAVAKPLESVSPEEGRTLAEIPVMFENTVVLRDSRQGRSVLYSDGHVEFVKEGVRFPATERTQAFIGSTAPHRSDGRPFQTGDNVKVTVIIILLLAPFVVGVVLLLMLAAGRSGLFGAFTAFMLYPPVMAAASHVVDLPRHFISSGWLLLLSAVLSWALILPMYGDYIKARRARGSRSSGCLLILAWCAFWLAMFYAMVLVPSAMNMGGAFL